MTHSHLLRLGLLVCVASWLSASEPAHALPQGAEIESGDVAISADDGGSLQITASDQAIIRWSSFDIASNEQVQFVQPSIAATVLNRVAGGPASQIAGQLTANGWVFLINPAGIVFAPTAVVQVAGLVASSLDLPNQAFLARQYRFLQPEGTTPGLVVNRGILQTTQPGGLIALLGGAVANEGAITARLGTVALAAGSQTTVSFDPDGRIAVAVDAPTAALVLGADGQAQDGAVNAGQIIADGGSVLVQAAALQEIFNRIINQTGIIEATTVEERNGRILLRGDGGLVQHTGRLSATGREAGATGGRIEMLGRLVGLLDQAQIDVSGDAGGGTALIGGDYQGQGSIPNAWRAYVGPETVVRADALTEGDGGRVIVWSDDATWFYGTLSARGGANSGNGGFVEVSGGNGLDFDGHVDAGAVNGLAGAILLDPKFLEVKNSGGSAYNNGTNNLFANNPGGTNTITATSINGFNGAVTLQANTDVTITTAIAATKTGPTSLTIQAGRSVIVNNNINTSARNSLGSRS